MAVLYSDLITTTTQDGTANTEIVSRKNPVGVDHARLRAKFCRVFHPAEASAGDDQVVFCKVKSSERPYSIKVTSSGNPTGSSDFHLGLWTIRHDGSIGALVGDNNSLSDIDTAAPITAYGENMTPADVGRTFADIAGEGSINTSGKEYFIVGVSETAAHDDAGEMLLQLFYTAGD